MLKITFLGGMKLEWQGTLLPFKAPPKASPLLAQLLLGRQAPIPRDTLAFSLWPEDDESTARANLRRHLYYLRRELPEQADEQPWVIKVGRGHHWNPASRFQLDVAAFERLSEQTDTLEQAAECYTGDLLPELYEDFIDYERQRLRNQYFENLSQLVSSLKDRGDYRRALLYAQQILQQDPWQEDMVRESLRLANAAGDRSGALQAYLQFTERLEAELDLPPMPETTALYEQIRAGAGSRDRATLEPAQIGQERPVKSHNFPPEFTAFVGRTHELLQIKTLLQDSSTRLLTLVGAGGIGKTRLAVQAVKEFEQVEERFPDGLYFISLAELSGPGLLVPALLNALETGPAAGDSGERQGLFDYLRRKRLLLLLDNFEHLMDGAELLTEILSHAPQVMILVTSRSPLNLQAELRLPLSGLAFPEDLDGVMGDYEAVQLFERVANRITLGVSFPPEQYAAIGRICHLVQGVPLALEMAANWVRMHSCERIAAEIERSLDFLVSPLRDAPDRHRSMRAVFEHTWESLPPTLQTALAHITMFPASFNLDAALAVADASALDLAALLDKSLLQRSPNGRYWIHELLRQFLAEQPQAQQAAERLNEQHAAYFLSMVRQQAPALLMGQLQVLESLSLELAHVRKAWIWACENQPDVAERALQGLFDFFQARGHFEEGRDLLASALTRDPGPSFKRFQMAVSARIACLDFQLGNRVIGRETLELSLDFWRDTSNAAELLFGLNWLGYMLDEQADYPGAAAALEEALLLAEELEDDYGLCAARFESGRLAYNRGDFSAAETNYTESLTLANRLGMRLMTGYSLLGLGSVTRYLTQYTMSETHMQKALRQFTELDHRRGQTVALNALADLVYVQGDFNRALEYYARSHHLIQETGDLLREGGSLIGQGNINHEMGDYSAAIAYFRQALQAMLELDHKVGEAICHNNLGNATRDVGDYARSLQHFETSLRIKREIGDIKGESVSLGNLCMTQLLVGDPEGARRTGEQGVEAAREIDYKDVLAGNLTVLGHAQTALAQLDEAAHSYRAAIDDARRALEPLGGIVDVTLRTGDLAGALEASQVILKSVGSGEIDSVHQALRVYWMCYKGLHANGDARARPFLAKAARLLEERAAKISEPEMRLLFRKAVPWNKLILDEVKKSL
jgi:DNA-binding SARP family transcriptional activator/predicted ATPase